MGSEKVIENPNEPAFGVSNQNQSSWSSRGSFPERSITEKSQSHSPQKKSLTKNLSWVTLYIGVIFLLDVILFSSLTIVKSGFWSSILFALGASQLVSIVLWRTRDGWQMAKWCIALLGMLLFSFWLNKVMESGWNQMWMICCLLVVSGRLLWGLIETQRKRPADQVGVERFQTAAQVRVRSFSIWNFLEWTIAAGLVLSVATLVYQNFLSSVLPMIGLLAFGFLCALSRLASAIVSENCELSLSSQAQDDQTRFPFLDAAGTLFILLAVNVAGYFWMKKTLVHFYDQSLDFVFVIAIVAQLWQLFDGLLENGFWRNLLDSIQKSKSELEVSASS